eukprot:3680161-Karenia_brevis.AAC.1
MESPSSSQVGSPKPSRFDKSLPGSPRDSGGSRSSMSGGGGGPLVAPSVAVSAVTASPVGRPIQ